MNKKNNQIEFPKDELAHDRTIEWWYFNGHLKDKRGLKYSFMNCFFKADVKKIKIPFLSKLPLKTSYFSHSILSDLNNKKSNSRITPFSLISSDSFSKPLLYINYLNPTIKNNYTNCVIEKINAATYLLKNENIDLKLTCIKKPLLEGGKGLLNLHPKITNYYSLTNLKTEGRIKIKNEWISVSGKSWMDHQWANGNYSKEDRWDWFSIQLNNNTEIVCFMYDNGKEKTYLAGISYPNGKQKHFKKIEIIPSGRQWVSPKSKAIYPLEWKIKIPEEKIELNLKAIIENQELLFGSINYWEGPISASGLFANKKVDGAGFMELVGYPSQYSDIKYINDELKKTAGWLFSIAKKNF